MFDSACKFVAHGVELRQDTALQRYRCAASMESTGFDKRRNGLLAVGQQQPRPDSATAAGAGGDGVENVGVDAVCGGLIKFDGLVVG